MKEGKTTDMNRREEIYLQGRCPCRECSGTRLDEKLVNWILDFEQKTGLKINITSGARCESYNREVGGYWDSPHLTDVNGIGHAIDFRIKGLKPIEVAFKVEEVALKFGWLELKRLGIYKYHVHGDLERPNPSKYWYTGNDGIPIYSKNINNLKDFLIQMKKEGRLSYDENVVFNRIIGNNFMADIPKKENGKYLGL